MSQPLNYIARIADYYRALGYGASYEWARFDDVPFARLQKPLAQARIGIVTTAAPYQADKGDQGPGAPYNGAAKFYRVYTGPTDHLPDLRISHIAYDRTHTKADDLGSYFPLRALQSLAKDEVIGDVSPRFYGLPTNRSKRTTLDQDCPDLLAAMQADQVDAAVLVPNCPVCHQSVTLAARALESAGIPTVIMGCAKDIVEHIGAPRLLFNNFPLGNGAGLPHDPINQRKIAQRAVTLLDTATAPRSTVQSPYAWSGDPDWKKDYSNAALLSPEEIAHRRAEFDRGKAAAKLQREEAQNTGEPR